MLSALQSGSMNGLAVSLDAQLSALISTVHRVCLSSCLFSLVSLDRLLRLFFFSGRWYFWQPVVTDNAPQFTLVWCFLTVDTGCAFLSGTREVMSELLSASNQLY